MKKMTFHFVLIASFMSLGMHTLLAQDKPTVTQVEHAIQSNGKYALMVMTQQHLKAALLTGTDFLNTSSAIDFQIVVCGAIVKEISTNDALKAEINQHVEKGLSVLICGLTLQNLKLDASSMPEKAGITQNGITYFFGLQEMGYKTLSL